MIRQAIAREERFRPEPGRTKRLGEAFERLGADLLGTIEGHPPAAQVQFRTLRGSRFLDAERS